MGTESPLEIAIRNSIYSCEELSKHLGISLETFIKKIDDEIEWTDEEKLILCKRLHIPLHYMKLYFDN